MISLAEAIQHVRASVPRFGTETVSLRDAFGRVLAEPVAARRTQPPFAASAMDGYAVRSSDLAGDRPQFRLAGESAAGHGSAHVLAAGEAMRISTGAPMPAGADQVVIQENSKFDGEHLFLSDTARPGANVRAAGIDFREGQRLLDAGQRLTPERISLAASGGFDALMMAKRPRVAILSTGDELVEPGGQTGPDQIINSLAPALEGLVLAWGGVPTYLGIARDTRADVEARLDAAREFDLLVTIGGASVGDHDHLRPAFDALGGRMVFEKIAAKPGKPTWFGWLDDCWCVGLPGNPVSALVMARLILKTALDAALGRADALVFETVTAGSDLPGNGSRETFIRAVERAGQVRPLDNQDSSALFALVASNCLIRRPAQAGPVRSGEAVDILRIA